MSKGVKTVLSIAAPIVGNIIAPGIGGVIGGAIGGGINGGVKGAIMGGITSYLGNAAAGAIGNAGANATNIAWNATPEIAGAVTGTVGQAVPGAVTRSVVNGIAPIGAGGTIQSLTRPITDALAKVPQNLLLNAASGIVGSNNQEAALKAAKQQADAATAGMAANQKALEPYTELGADATKRIGEIQADPAAYIKGNQLYGTLAADAERRLLANAAAKGKVGSGGTAAALQEQLLNIGTGLVNTEIGNLQNQAGLGGNAASNVGAVNASGNVAVGNANAAGTIGANNAMNSTYQNQINTILAAQNANRAPVYSQPINL